jgi:ABC-type Fe3+-hydroxamate transport system substrate-binding protein
MFTHSATFPVFGRLRPTLFAMSLAAMLPFSACSDNGPTTVSVAHLVGTRPMRTADNKNVPTTFTDGKGKQLTIMSGALKITSDGKYTLAYVGHLGTLDFDLEDEGVVHTQGTTLVFTPSDGEAAFTGASSGGTIVVGFKIAGVKFDLGFRQ